MNQPLDETQPTKCTYCTISLHNLFLKRRGKLSWWHMYIYITSPSHVAASAGFLPRRLLFCLGFGLLIASAAYTTDHKKGFNQRWLPNQYNQAV